MIHPSATFSYVGTVPHLDAQASGDWRLHEPGGGLASTIARLVGRTPSLTVTDAGMTGEVKHSPYTGIVRPRALLSRLTLRAVSKDDAYGRSFSFCVTQGLTRAWRPGDVLHLVRTGTGAFGLSVVRDGRLMAAAGAVSSVALGRDVSVRIPWDEVREADGVLRRLDPEFEFPHLPVEVRCGAGRCVCHGGRRRIGGYAVYIEHGFYRGVPGVCECVALSAIGEWPETDTISSAQLMEYRDLTTTEAW